MEQYMTVNGKKSRFLAVMFVCGLGGVGIGFIFAKLDKFLEGEN